MLLVLGMRAAGGRLRQRARGVELALADQLLPAGSGRAPGLQAGAGGARGCRRRPRRAAAASTWRWPTSCCPPAPAGRRACDVVLVVRMRAADGRYAARARGVALILAD